MFLVSWSPDGELLVSAGLKGDIIVWNPTDLSVLRRLQAPEWVIGAKFTPDGTRLITAGGSAAFGSRDRLVQIWGVPPWWHRFF